MANFSRSIFLTPFAFIASVLLFGCDEPIIPSDYIQKPLKDIILLRYQVYNEAIIMVGKHKNEQPSQCLQYYNNAASSLNTIIDVIVISLKANSGVNSKSLALPDLVTDFKNNGKNFIDCSNENIDTLVVSSITPIDSGALVKTIADSILQAQKEEHTQQSELAKEISNLKLPSFNQLIPPKDPSKDPSKQ